MAEGGIAPRVPRRARGAVCVLLLVAWLLPAAGEEEKTPARPPTPTPDEETYEVDETAGTVVGGLQGQSGVRIQTMCTHCNSANVQVGGLSQDLAPIFFGPYPLIGGLAVSYVLNMLLPDSVAEAKIIRGPGEAREPPVAAGGVIGFVPATPREIPWLTFEPLAGSFHRREATLRAAGPVADWLGGAVTIGAEEADPVDGDGDGWIDAAGVDRFVADARIEMATRDRAHRFDLGGSYIDETDFESRGAFDVLRFARESLAGEFVPAWTREDADFTRTQVQAGWEWRMEDGGRLALHALEARRDQTVISQLTADPELPASESRMVDRYAIEETDRWGRLQWDRPWGLDWRSSAGIDADYESVSATEFDLRTEKPLQTQVDYVKMWGGFVQADWTPSGMPWGLQIGARYDKDANYGSAVQPRATLSYYPARGVTLRALVGRTFRPPKPIFAEVCCGQRYRPNFETGVGSERAWTYGVEGTYQPSPALRVSLYLAQTDFDDHILRLVAQSQLYVQAYTNANIPSARSKVAEIAAQWRPIPQVTLDASAGWLSFRNTGNEQVAIRYNPFSSEELITEYRPIDRIPYRPSRTASAGINWEIWRGISVLLQANYTGPQQIQQFRYLPPGVLTVENLLLDDLREVDDFWLVNFSFVVPVTSWLEITGGIDNLNDYVQNDLGDPTRDYNWGPLTGISYRLGLRFALNRS